jgi:hypothetical protein
MLGAELNAVADTKVILLNLEMALGNSADFSWTENFKQYLVWHEAIYITRRNPIA